MSKTAVGPWALNATLTSAQMTSVDANAAGCIDKSSAGDTFAGPITSSGASASITMVGASTGGLTIANGSKIQCNGALNLGSTCVTTAVSGSATAFNSGSALTVSTGCVAQVFLSAASSFVSVPTSGAGFFNGGNGPSDYHIGSSSHVIAQMFTADSAQSNAWTNAMTSADAAGLVSTIAGTTLRTPLKRTHNGATLSSVALTMIIVGGHAALPGTMPQFNVLRVNTTTGAVTALAGSNAVLTAPNVGAYNGQTLSWTLTTTTANVIDTSTYDYFLRLTDEGGGNSLAGNTAVGFRCTYSAIADLTFP